MSRAARTLPLNPQPVGLIGRRRLLQRYREDVPDAPPRYSSNGADPANTQWQRDLSVSHNKLGNVAVAGGDLAAARAAYQASLNSVSATS